jgi:hypothetical protein
LFVFVFCLVYRGVQHILLCVFILFVFVLCHKIKTQHNMCWTPLCTRHKTKTNKIKTQSNMSWTPLYTRHKTKTNKIIALCFYFVCLCLVSCV